MELELTDDQELLRDSTARFIADVCPLSRVRELAEAGADVGREYLAQAGELGWFAMLVPEEHGGGSVSGEGLADLAVVAEERGRQLQPGPFVPMNVVASAIAAGATPETAAALLPAIVGGEVVATWVAAEGTVGWDPGSTVTARADGDGWVLDGRSPLVEAAAEADWFLVTAGGADGLSQFLVPATADGLSTTALESHDITRRFGAVRLDGVRVGADGVVGVPGGAAADVERQLDIALVLVVAESVGAADVLFEMTRQYAVDRVAFGRPIGSFQAIKHQLADLMMELEAGKAISVMATRAVQAGDPEAAEVASMAKAWLGDTGITLAQGCFQVFAGIGYTWEHDSHLYLRRLTLDSRRYGAPEWHRERICVEHGL